MVFQEPDDTVGLTTTSSQPASSIVLTTSNGDPLAIHRVGTSSMPSSESLRR